MSGEQLKSGTIYPAAAWPGAVVAGSGLVCLAGWVLDVPALTDWFGSGISIQPNAALCALLFGVALVLAAGGAGRAAALVAAAVALVAGVTVLEHLFRVDAGLDRLLTFGRDWGYAGAVAPGRMGVPASVSWTLLGLGLVAASRPGLRRRVPVLALVVLVLAGVSLTGYLYGVDALKGIPRLTTIGVHTALFVALGAIGLLLTVPDQDPVRAWFDEGGAGILARWALPLLVAVPVVTGYGALRAEQAGWVDRPMGAALTLVLLIVVSSAILWRAVVGIRHRERALEAARRARGLANQAREESEARVAAILESIDDSFVIFDRDWHYTYVNAAAARAVARRPDELLGRRLWDLFPELHGTPMEAALLEVAEGRVMREFDAFNPVMQRWYSNRAYPTPDGGVSVYFRDVEDQRRMRERAFQSEQQAQTLIRNMPGGVFLVDRSLRFLVADGAGLREGPAAALQLVGRTLDEALPPDKAALFRPLYEGALAGIPFVQEDEMGGRVFNIRGVPLRAEDGTVYAVLAISHDVTERKRGEQAKAAAARQLHLVTDMAPVMLAHLDRELRYKFANRPYAARFGLTPADLVGRTVPELFGAGSAVRFSEQVQKVLAGQPVQFEFEMAARDGSEPRYLYAAYSPEFGDDGRVVGLVAGLVDITERRRAEDALREADRRKDEFLATLAHELRNPLAPISNSIDILARSGANPALLRTVQETLRRQVNHLTKLVDDLMDIGRINRNKLELRREDVALSAVLEHSMESCGPMIDGAGQHLAVQLPEEPLTLNGDAVRLSQVFSNLLSNASRYNHRGGRIELVAAARDGFVEVRVRDTGIGIPPDQLDAVFEPFFQVQDAAARESGGLGIGLSLVKRLVELHGGSVAARSDGPGRGAEFLVRLPLVASTGLSVVAPRRTADPPRGHRVLVVDDNVDSADSLALLLGLSGHEVHKAYNGADALACAAACGPDVVILDLGLPGMSGYEVCRALRRDQAGRDLLVVALTGWGQPRDRERTAEAGFDAHLVKPVDQDALEAVMRRRFATAAGERGSKPGGAAGEPGGAARPG